MNMNRLILGVLLFAWFPFYSAAQAPVRTEKQKIERIGKIYSDSLQQLKTLYNDWKYEEADTLSGNNCEVIIAKHRSGPTGSVRLAWIARYTKFGNLEHTV